MWVYFIVPQIQYLKILFIKLLPKNLTFLMGDFNINLFKFASDTEVQSFENFSLSKGLHPSISLATHKRSDIYISHFYFYIYNIIVIILLL